MRISLVFFAAVSSLVTSAVRADIRLPAILGSNMVLQAETDAAFWGWADPGELVTIAADWPGAIAVSVVTTPEGTWQTTLPTPAAGGGYTITIAGKNTLTLTNVLLGEVWLCSGQSNMVWFVRRSNNPEAEIAAADYPEVRLFIVENTISPMPLEDCRGEWVVCSPETVANFSAVGYTFGRVLNEQLGTPVGLIASDWGGTPLHAWTREEVLLKYAPRFRWGLESLQLLREEPERLEAEYQRALAAWKAKHHMAEQLIWANTDFDDTTWTIMDQPTAWRTPDLRDYDGTVWFRRDIEIPVSWAGRALTIELGPIDDQDTTFFNGVEVGAHRGAGHWNTARRYRIASELVKPGRAVIGVSVFDTNNAGGMHGRPEQMFLVPRDGSESERLSLAGPWRYKIGSSPDELANKPQKRGMASNTPSAIYNGMIAPLTPLSIRGVIWYQGESNRRFAHEYRSLFPEMITDWREQWGGSGESGGSDFPFYFVQIAPFTYPGDVGETAELREAQLMALSLPNTGMVVTMDIGDPNDIHPGNKRDVGERLARWALAKTYNQPGIVYSGPLYRDVVVSGSQVIVRFDHAEGLVSRGGALKGFEIAGEDQVWRAAGALIDGETVVLSAYGITKPVAVRYGWDDDDEPNLFNSEGLPASPFRTDDWKRVTQP